jgi:tagatose 6-phosphate kinase
MITTVTLNAAIDKTYSLPAFQPGTVMRVKEMTAEAGGKGVNVARVIKQLGLQSLATGFVGGHNGAFIEKELERQGISHDFVHVEEESRLCLNLIDISNGQSTEVLEQGPWIKAELMVEFQDKLLMLARKSSTLIFSGSIPRGLPATIYAELIAIVRETNVSVFLDTSGESLRHGMKEAPFFIKPNEDEMAQIVGKQPVSEADHIANVQQLMNQGIECVCVSLGAGGSITGYHNQIFRVSFPAIEAINPVGSGDAYVAGMAAGMHLKKPFEECLRLASACGTANALSSRAGYVQLKQVQSLMKQVEIRQLN